MFRSFLVFFFFNSKSDNCAIDKIAKSAYRASPTVYRLAFICDHILSAAMSFVVILEMKERMGDGCVLLINGYGEAVKENTIDRCCWCCCAPLFSIQIIAMFYSKTRICTGLQFHIASITHTHTHTQCILI